MTIEPRRRVSLSRLERGRYRATNGRGAELILGHGENDDFTPVELLLVAMAGCSAVDVDFITSKRSEPERFDVVATGEKMRDELGNRLVDLLLDFQVVFPDDERGVAAESVLARAVGQSHDRLCTVTRTIEVPSPVAIQVRGAAVRSTGAAQR